MRRAIAFISEHWRAQPTIESIADAAGVTPDELHHLFRRWAGLSPKAFMQAITLDHARALLRDSASVLDAGFAVGLSGPGRLHDLFVTHEAMTPGQWKAGGDGLTMRFGFHPSPFGNASYRHRARPRRARLRRRRRPAGGLGRHAPALAAGHLRRGRAATGGLARRIFDMKSGGRTPLRVVLIGTDFEVRVWETLLAIPMGRAASYSRIAVNLGTPEGVAGRRRRRGQEPDLLRGALPSRARRSVR